MRIAYFDCFSGASGDMILGGLVDAGADLSAIQAAIQSMGLPEIRFKCHDVQKNGFRANQLTVEHPPEHAHRHLSDIAAMIERGSFSAAAKQLALAIFRRIAIAEAKVHGSSLEEVHFHEVGAIDSIADIVGVSIAWEQLGAETAYASAVPVGDGQIMIAHGLVSIPAPATAEILQGIPIAPTNISAELTTPTGAAILAELVTGFGPLPSMQISRIGYGAGTRDLTQRPNLLRIMIGDALRIRRRDDDSVAVIETNLDDVSGEQIGFAIDTLWKAGALDVFTTPVQMKKGRPGVLLTILAQPTDRQRFERILFEQTGTLGIRHRQQERTVATRSMTRVETVFGSVRGKIAKLPDGSIDFSPEFDDCKALAQRHNTRLPVIVEAAKAAFFDTDINEKKQAESTQAKPAKHTHSHSHDLSHSHEHTHSHDHSHSHDLPVEENDAPSDKILMPTKIPKSHSYHAPTAIRRPYFLDRPEPPAIGTEHPPESPETS